MAAWKTKKQTCDSFWRRLSLGDISGTVFDRPKGFMVAFASSILAWEYDDIIDAFKRPSSTSSSSLSPGSFMTAVTRVWQPPQLTDSTVKFSNRATLTGLNWFEKHSSPCPNFPCLPSPNVYSLPFSDEEKTTWNEIMIKDIASMEHNCKFCD